jgi:hypothetical protein
MYVLSVSSSGPVWTMDIESILEDPVICFRGGGLSITYILDSPNFILRKSMSLLPILWLILSGLYLIVCAHETMASFLYPLLLVYCSMMWFPINKLHWLIVYCWSSCSFFPVACFAAVLLCCIYSGTFSADQGCWLWRCACQIGIRCYDCRNWHISVDGSWGNFLG